MTSKTQCFMYNNTGQYHNITTINQNNQSENSRLSVSRNQSSDELESKHLKSIEYN